MNKKEKEKERRGFKTNPIPERFSVEESPL
jgi:hypothetical protein